MKRIFDKHKKYGKLQPINKIDRKKYEKTKWNCKCDCGNYVVIKQNSLVSGHSKTCGCVYDDKANEIIGQRFDNITITGICRQDTRGKYYYYYKCRCGQTGTIRKCAIKERKRCKKCRDKEFYKGLCPKYYYRTRGRAILLKRDFSISPEYIMTIFCNQNGKCALTGIDLILPNSENGTKCTASLDRIDSSKGYIEGNVQWVHKKVNIMKRDMSDEEFIEICNKVSKFRGQK